MLVGEHWGEPAHTPIHATIQNFMMKEGGKQENLAAHWFIQVHGWEEERECICMQTHEFFLSNSWDPLSSQLSTSYALKTTKKTRLTQPGTSSKLSYKAAQLHT